MGTAVTVPERRDLAVLEVTGGAHTGVEAAVGATAIRIGSGGRSDIVLSDDGVAEEHALLRFDGGDIFIEARGAEVGYGRHVIPRGQGCRARLPVELRFGSCAMRLKRPMGARRSMRGSIGAAGIAVLVVGSLVATQADAIKTIAGVDAPAAAAADVANADPAPAGVDLAAAPASGEDPVAALRRRVAEAQIEGLRIETEGDRIVARGVLDDAARKRWSATQRWFDGAYSGRYVLASEVGAKSAATMPRFQVQAIWFGATPYVVTADGQRRRPGATLGDGWIIKDIRDGRLTVAKAGEEVALNF
jgi:hypothetical protein